MKEVFKIVSTKSLGIDDVGPQDFVHAGGVDAGILLKPGKVDARGVAADHAVGLG